MHCPVRGTPFRVQRLLDETFKFHWIGARQDNGGNKAGRNVPEVTLV